LTDTAGNVSVLCVVGVVSGVTQLHNIVYIVNEWSSAILRFNATTHQRLTDINVHHLRHLSDIVACERTSQLYIADYERCVWRVSSDNEDIQRWLPTSATETFEPRSLSVTSTRLLVTTDDTHQLIQFDSDGDELRRVQLPDDMELHHAVESPTGTFIVSLYNAQMNQGQVVEVNNGGEVLRQFSGSRLRSLSSTEYIAVDSHGNIIVADNDFCILLLDAHLSLRRVIIDEHQLNYKLPYRLCYREHSGQLLVGLPGVGVAMFDALCR